jgi:hypothetical protein
MTVINDNNCSWLTNVPRKFFFKTISDNLECNYLVVGAGIKKMIRRDSLL